MLNINMADVIKILELCRPYLIAFGVVFVLAVITMIAVRKMEVAKRKMVRAQSILATILALVIVANFICIGPMSTILSLATQKVEVLSEETKNKSNEDCREIAREGIVLLENEGLLPLSDTKNLNVFGWASTNPIYGGTGAGALNDLFHKVTPFHIVNPINPMIIIILIIRFFSTAKIYAKANINKPTGLI